MFNRLSLIHVRLKKLKFKKKINLNLKIQTQVPQMIKLYFKTNLILKLCSEFVFKLLIIFVKKYYS